MTSNYQEQQEDRQDRGGGGALREMPGRSPGFPFIVIGTRMEALVAIVLVGEVGGK